MNLTIFMKETGLDTTSALCLLGGTVFLLSFIVLRVCNALFKLLDRTAWFQYPRLWWTDWLFLVGTCLLSAGLVVLDRGSAWAVAAVGIGFLCTSLTVSGLLRGKTFGGPEFSEAQSCDCRLRRRIHRHAIGSFRHAISRVVSTSRSRWRPRSTQVGTCLGDGSSSKHRPHKVGREVVLLGTAHRGVQMAIDVFDRCRAGFPFTGAGPAVVPVVMRVVRAFRPLAFTAAALLSLSPAWATDAADEQPVRLVLVSSETDLKAGGQFVQVVEQQIKII